MYKALVSFCGLYTMAKGEIGEIADKKVVADLLDCGYIEEIGNTPKTPEEKPKKTVEEKPKRRRKKKANEEGE